MVPFVANGANAECHRPPRHEPTPIVERNFVPTDGSSCRLLNGDLGTSPSCWQQWGGEMVLLVCVGYALFGRIAMGKPRIFRCSPSLFSPLHTTYRQRCTNCP